MHAADYTRGKNDRFLGRPKSGHIAPRPHFPPTPPPREGEVGMGCPIGKLPTKNRFSPPPSKEKENPFWEKEGCMWDPPKIKGRTLPPLRGVGLFYQIKALGKGGGQPPIF